MGDLLGFCLCLLLVFRVLFYYRTAARDVKEVPLVQYRLGLKLVGKCSTLGEFVMGFSLEDTQISALENLSSSYSDSVRHQHTRGQK